MGGEGKGGQERLNEMKRRGEKENEEVVFFSIFFLFIILDTNFTCLNIIIP